MPRDVEIRLLRGFVGVAEELHFGRAAARLHVAQQALSRDVRRLEAQLGAVLFRRTTRRVELTEQGERLLPRARALLERHDALVAEFSPAAPRPLLVDVAAPVSTGSRVLAEARRIAPGAEMLARYHGGLTDAAARILDGSLDVSFGRAGGLDPAMSARLAHRLVRYEPLAVLLPADHPLAGLAEVPLDALAGERVYAAAGNPGTAEWTDLAERLFAGRGIAVAEPYPPIVGDEEFGRVVRERGEPVLASVEFVDLPGMVLRPLVRPVPLSPVFMVWRRQARTHPALDALHHAVRSLVHANAWLERTPGSWLSPADAALAALTCGNER